MEIGPNTSESLLKMIQTHLVAFVPWAATTKLQILLLWLSLHLLRSFPYCFLLFSAKSFITLMVLARCSRSVLKLRLVAGFRPRSPLIEPFLGREWIIFSLRDDGGGSFYLSFLTARGWGHGALHYCFLSNSLLLSVSSFFLYVLSVTVQMH